MKTIMFVLAGAGFMMGISQSEAQAQMESTAATVGMAMDVSSDAVNIATSAQNADSMTGAQPSEKTTPKTEVKDYKTFLQFVEELDRAEKIKTSAHAPKKETEKKIVQFDRKKFRLANDQVLELAKNAGPIQINNDNKIGVLTFFRPGKEKFEILDAVGKIVFELNEIGVASVYSLDGNYYVFHTRVSIDSPDPKIGCFVYDKEGKLLKHFDENWSSYAFSKDGNYFAITTFGENHWSDLAKPAFLSSIKRTKKNCGLNYSVIPYCLMRAMVAQKLFFLQIIDMLTFWWKVDFRLRKLMI